MQLPDIFKSPILKSETDVCWDTELLPNLPIADTIVISQTFLSGSPEEQQLHKMMQACKLLPNQFNILQLENEQQLAWYQIREKYKPSKILLLGVMPAQLNIGAMMVAHEVNDFDGAKWMPTASLAELIKNDALKKHLWVNVFQKVYF